MERLPTDSHDLSRAGFILPSLLVSEGDVMEIDWVRKCTVKERPGIGLIKGVFSTLIASYGNFIHLALKKTCSSITSSSYKCALYEHLQNINIGLFHSEFIMLLDIQSLETLILVGLP